MSKISVVAEELKLELLQDDSVVAASVFGSVMSGELWQRSDIDLFVITNEAEEERWEGVYTRRQKVMIHLQVLSLASLREVIEMYPGGPFFAALGSSTIWFDHTGDLTTAWQKAKNFQYPQTRLRACKEFCDGLQSLHLAEKYLALHKYDDAKLAYLNCLQSFVNARLSENGTYPSRDIWAQKQTCQWPEWGFWQAAEQGRGEGLGSLIDALFAIWRPLMSQFASPIVEAIGQAGRISMPELEEVSSLKRMEIPERLMDELLASGLIVEEQEEHPVLNLRQIVYALSR